MVEDGGDRMRNNRVYPHAVVDGRVTYSDRRPSVWRRVTSLVIVVVCGAVSIGLTVWLIVAIVVGVISLLS